MKILMISLDKNILYPQSAVAGRMLQYGHHDEIFIVVPAPEGKNFDLSSTVHVFSTGGNFKFIQFFKILNLGSQLIREKKVEEITVQDPFFVGLLGWLLKVMFRVRLEVQLHGDFFGSNYYHGFKILLGKWVVRRADKLRTVGGRVKTSLLVLGINEKKIRIMPVQSASTDATKFFPKFNIHEKYGENKKIFLALGRLEKVKNLSWLIEIFHQVAMENTEALLLIVGSGSEEKKLKEKVKVLGLTGRIKFENWTTDPWSYIKTADCLVIFSLSEGYGLTAMEAFASGTPVIMTDVGVANYELKPGHKVKIVPVGNMDEFKKAILSI